MQGLNLILVIIKIFLVILTQIFHTRGFAVTCGAACKTAPVYKTAKYGKGLFAETYLTL